MKNKLCVRITAVITAAFFLFGNIPLAEAKLSKKNRNLIIGAAVVGVGVGVGLKTGAIQRSAKSLAAKHPGSFTAMTTALGTGLGYLATRKHKDTSVKTAAMLLGAGLGAVTGLKTVGTASGGIVGGGIKDGAKIVKDSVGGFAKKHPLGFTAMTTTLGTGIGYLATRKKDRSTKQTAMLIGGGLGLVAGGRTSYNKKPISIPELPEGQIKVIPLSEESQKLAEKHVEFLEKQLGQPQVSNSKDAFLVAQASPPKYIPGAPLLHKKDPEAIEALQRAGITFSGKNPPTKTDEFLSKAADSNPNPNNYLTKLADDLNNFLIFLISLNPQLKKR